MIQIYFFLFSLMDSLEDSSQGSIGFSFWSCNFLIGTLFPRHLSGFIQDSSLDCCRVRSGILGYPWGGGGRSCDSLRSLRRFHGHCSGALVVVFFYGRESLPKFFQTLFFSGFFQDVHLNFTRHFFFCFPAVFLISFWWIPRSIFPGILFVVSLQLGGSFSLYLLIPLPFYFVAFSQEYLDRHSYEDSFRIL